jgi:hypothetical protein
MAAKSGGPAAPRIGARSAKYCSKPPGHQLLTAEGLADDEAAQLMARAATA